MVSAVYFIGVQRHQLQQIKLLGCQIDLFSTNVESAAVTIQVKISLLHHAAWLLLRLFLLRPADDRFDPRFYFQNIEWFGNIIVCSILQTHDLVHIIAFGGQHDHRHIGKFPELLTYFKAGQFGKHNIKKHHIILICSELFQCLFSVISTIHFHIVLLQTEPDSFDDQLFIIYY